jgi:hypothetical protein
MSKYKLVSYLFVLLGLIIIIGAAYLIISYASDILNAIVDFVSTNGFAKLQQCGVTPPPQFSKIKADLTSVILPFLYVGIPLLLIVISALMFMGGFYYHKGKFEDESRKHEELERQMVHKLVKRMESSKASGRPSEGEPGEELPEEEPAPEAPEPEEPEPAPEEEQEEAPKARPKAAKKRK